MTDDPQADTPEARAAREAFYQQMEAGLTGLHNLARETQNPVYAWLALWNRSVVHQTRAMHGEEAGDLCIPAWCAEYFSGIASDITALASGYDIRRDPEAEMHLWTTTTDAETGQVTLHPPPIPLLPPDKAKDLIPFALFLTDRGYNAFASFRAGSEQMALYHRFQDLRAEGLSYADAMDALSTEEPKEQSVLRKRVSSGRRLFELGQASSRVTGKT